MVANVLLDNLVSASQFSQGQSAKCFEKARDGEPVVVLRNNVPYRVVLTCGDFGQMRELEEDVALLELALARLERNQHGAGIPAEEVYAEFGITPEDLDAIDDVELA